MREGDRKITARDLLKVTLDSMTEGLHPVMKTHGQQVAASYEAALGIRLPRASDEVPHQWRTLFLLYSSTLKSAAALQHPLSGFLEAGLLLVVLERAGTHGAQVRSMLETASAATRALREQHLDILCELLVVFGAAPLKEATLAEVINTGLYPGSTPKDFDLFDHL